MKPSIQAKLAQLTTRLAEVNTLLAEPDVTRDLDNYRKLTREHAELEPVVELFRQYQAAEQDLATAHELLADPDMKAFAQDEIDQAKETLMQAKTDAPYLAAGGWANTLFTAIGIAVAATIALRIFWQQRSTQLQALVQQQLDVSQAKDTPNIQYVLKPIMSAIETVKKQMTDDQLARSFIDEVTMMNVKNNIAYILKHSDVLREMVENGEVGIVGAIYDVKTGQVDFL